MTNLGQRAVAGTRLLFLSLGLLILRLAAGGMMITHGWAKYQNFGEMKAEFADPLGVGNTNSLLLVIFAELVCAAAVMLGLATRLAAVPLIVAMGVAGFVIHAEDAFKVKELAFLYLTVFSTLLLTGPGLFSADALAGSWWRRRKAK